MAAFHAVYYREANGSEPVRAYLDDLDDGIGAVLAQQIDRLNLLSDEVPHLPFPHSSQVDGELRELRCHYGRQLYRVLYRRSDRLLVLLHIFAKRTAKIPAAEMNLAHERWLNFKDRMDAQPRRPPRAAGHDAP
ncbi:MAG: type II toxin-antitoxin system RelE/ParE family toxin [Acidimicrobiia bacterium]|nr:type II toxin-antitoxin system RelE/ParE family toxin [Acidimicrobiia bacterium]